MRKKIDRNIWYIFFFLVPGGALYYYLYMKIIIIVISGCIVIKIGFIINIQYLNDLTVFTSKITDPSRLNIVVMSRFLLHFR